MAIAQRRLPWRLPTKWAWAMEKAGPSRKEAAELWRDPARFPMALSLVSRLPLWRDLARFPMALSLVLRLPLWRDLARFPMALSLVLRLPLWRDLARFPMALSLVLRLPLWRELARFPMALSLVLRLPLWRDLARFPMALSLVLRLPLEPQAPSSPAPKRWSSRPFPARHLRPCYRLTRIRRPPGDRERRVQRRSNLLVGPHPALRAPRPRGFVPRAPPSGSGRKERRSAGAGVHCSIARV